MKQLALAIILTLAATGGAFAQATVPIGTPPVAGRPTANLVLDAMMATARAAATNNPSAAQAASLNTSAAVQRYNQGDEAGARSAAIQALIEANRTPPTANPILRSTIPQTSYLQTQPFPIAGGSVGAIDAQAFVAQARGAVAACASRNSANTSAATQQLAAAQRDAQAGRYLPATTEARAAVDLCAAAQRAINQQP
jgi:hypothetical protein